jgi:hypothetical protein
MIGLQRTLWTNSAELEPLADEIFHVGLDIERVAKVNARAFPQLARMTFGEPNLNFGARRRLYFVILKKAKSIKINT